MIKLDKNYYIDSDSYCWKLCYKEKKTKEDGKTYTSKDYWYFPTIKDCIKRYVDSSLKGVEGNKDLKELIDKLNKIEQQIENICPNITFKK